MRQLRLHGDKESTRMCFFAHLSKSDRKNSDSWGDKKLENISLGRRFSTAYGDPTIFHRRTLSVSNGIGGWFEATSGAACAVAERFAKFSISLLVSLLRWLNNTRKYLILSGEENNGLGSFRNRWFLPANVECWRETSFFKSRTKEQSSQKNWKQGYRLNKLSGL